MPASTTEIKPPRASKPGPGRPPGRKNNKTLALEEAARKAAASIDGAFEGDAHAFLQAVYRNPEVPLEIRIMAAGRALRVEKPALAASQSRVEVNFDIGKRLEAARERVQRASPRNALGPTLEAEPVSHLTGVSDLKRVFNFDHQRASAFFLDIPDSVFWAAAC